MIVLWLLIVTNMVDLKLLFIRKMGALDIIKMLILILFLNVITCNMEQLMKNMFG